MTLLKISPSGQVYDVDLPEVRLTPDQGGGFYLHGRGHFLFFADIDAAREKKKELEFRGAF
ncbi:MAG TPA: hypothetical protein VG245_04235 [Candidatus Dormibacteraeota bacterium]|nr:hypothetical protein [Candidatus Dormibacteraeota bacterium]